MDVYNPNSKKMSTIYDYDFYTQISGKKPTPVKLSK